MILNLIKIAIVSLLIILMGHLLIGYINKNFLEPSSTETSLKEARKMYETMSTIISNTPREPQYYREEPVSGSVTRIEDLAESPLSEDINESISKEDSRDDKDMQEELKRFMETLN
tara:strand:- start:5616 stop:5963 length:348 start_codon:yes stop_codon:yes gene_type:complete